MGSERFELARLLGVEPLDVPKRRLEVSLRGDGFGVPFLTERKAFAREPENVAKSATPIVSIMTQVTRPPRVTGNWSPHPTVVAVT